MEHAVCLNEKIDRDIKIPLRKHIIVGTLAGAALPLFYLAILGFTQGLEHAIGQAKSILYWIAILAVAFGVQAGLFSFVRTGMRAHKGATASMVASGGSSTGSMAACCLHHVNEVLPFLGLSSTATFLVRYQLAFLVLALLSNFLGIIFLLGVIQRFRLCPVVSRWTWNLSKLRKPALVLSAVIVSALFLIVSFES